MKKTKVINQLTNTIDATQSSKNHEKLEDRLWAQKAIKAGKEGFLSIKETKIFMDLL